MSLFNIEYNFQRKKKLESYNLLLLDNIFKIKGINAFLEPPKGSERDWLA